MRRNTVLMILITFLLVACNMPAKPPSADPAKDLMGTVVAATMQALKPQASPKPSATPLLLTPAVTATPSVTPTPVSVKVSGKVCYHDSNILQLVLYFENSTSKAVLTKTVNKPVEKYDIDLPAGTYKIYGWPTDYSIGVLASGRPTITVADGQPQQGVDFCDYSQGASVPYPPGLSAASVQGSVAGNIYGYGGSGHLTVVAFNQTTGYWFYVILQKGESAYSISGLPAGTYQVVAYDGSGNAGGTAPNIAVGAGQAAVADISNWSGSFPSNPAP